MVIALFVVLVVLGLCCACVALALFTEDAVSAAGCVKEGQVW